MSLCRLLFRPPLHTGSVIHLINGHGGSYNRCYEKKGVHLLFLTSGGRAAVRLVGPWGGNCIRGRTSATWTVDGLTPQKMTGFVNVLQGQRRVLASLAHA